MTNYANNKLLVTNIFLEKIFTSMAHSCLTVISPLLGHCIPSLVGNLYFATIIVENMKQDKTCHKNINYNNISPGLYKSCCWSRVSLDILTLEGADAAGIMELQP